MHLPYRVIALAGFVFPLIFISTSAAVSQSHNRPTTNPTTNRTTDRTTNPTTNLGGRYSVFGTNPDGGEYTGSLEVIPRGGVYQFRWNAGTQYDGIGVIALVKLTQCAREHSAQIGVDRVHGRGAVESHDRNAVSDFYRHGLGFSEHECLPWFQ